jgi:pimeloyl-ACP methyl ester carboxylesterase
MPDGCVDVFVTADGDVMIAGPANTFYDMPAGDQEETAVKERLPGAVLTILSGVGHMPMLDDPELVARTILAVTSAAVK